VGDGGELLSVEVGQEPAGKVRTAGSDHDFAGAMSAYGLGPGSYVLVPRDTRHTISAGAGGGRLLVLMVPGGLEEMFFELATLPPDSITDPAVRAAISARYDSSPA
jgi:hypothetical protein